jgi:hypothetical protein
MYPSNSGVVCPSGCLSRHARRHLNDKVNNMSSAVTADTAEATPRHSPDPGDVISRVQVLIVVVTEIEPEAPGMLLLTMVSPEQTPILPSLQD